MTKMENDDDAERRETDEKKMTSLMAPDGMRLRIETCRTTNRESVAAKKLEPPQ